MSPTLRPGQIVICRRVYKSGRQPAVGDIVVFSHGGLDKIKRVGRLEGGKVYLLGDNPEASVDSRDFGWLETKVILGRLVWPKSVPGSDDYSNGAGG